MWKHEPAIEIFLIDALSRTTTKKVQTLLKILFPSLLYFCAYTHTMDQS